MNTLLEIKNLSKLFPVQQGIFGADDNRLIHAVDSVDLTIRQGESIGIVGESGCGKSTLAHLIVKLLSPTKGNITFQDKTIESNFSKNVQYVFQDAFASLNPRMRVFDLLQEPFQIHKLVDKKTIRTEIMNLLKLTDLETHHLSRFPHQLSGGQKQRVVLARVLALKPKIVLLDEPVSGLDVSIKAQIINLLLDIQKKFKATYIFISHDLPTLQYICERILVMYSGQIIEDAPVEELFSSPRHPYSEGLISSIPIPDPKQRRLQANLEGEIQIPINPPPFCRFAGRCKISTEKCLQEQPEMQLLTKRHSVRCFYPLSSK